MREKHRVIPAGVRLLLVYYSNPIICHLPVERNNGIIIYYFIIASGARAQGQGHIPVIPLYIAKIELLPETQGFGMGGCCDKMRQKRTVPICPFMTKIVLLPETQGFSIGSRWVKTGQNGTKKDRPHLSPGKMGQKRTVPICPLLLFVSGFIMY